MSRDRGTDGTAGEVVRYAPAIHSDGHAWVLVRDSADWFYECLRCAERAHVLSIEKMNKAVTHHYAYMPLRHRAPWKRTMTVRVPQPSGQIVEEKRSAWPPCLCPDAPLPDMSRFTHGPLLAVPKGGGEETGR